MNIIPEQFTVKAHPASFDGERRGRRGEPKNEALLFQSTVDILSKRAQNITVFQSTVDIHFQNAHKTHKKLRRLAPCSFIIKTIQKFYVLNNPVLNF